MNIPTDCVDERLALMKRATSGLMPSSGFEARVMLAVKASAVDLKAVIWRQGRYGLLLSLLAFGFAAGMAVHSESHDDEQQAVAYGTAELEW